MSAVTDSIKAHVALSAAGVTLREYAQLCAVCDMDKAGTAQLAQAAKTHRHTHYSELSAKILKGLDLLEQVLNDTERMGVQMCIKSGDKYPPSLAAYDDAPYILYMLGDTSLANRQLAAVVGSRRCTRYGETQTEIIVKGLVQNNVTVVSGLAEGVDTVAARSAFKYGGRAICVIAGGFDNIYPNCNRALFEQHAEQGLAISEYPPHFKPVRYMFPLRNRIMAYMSHAVVLTEAGQKSGALITANIAINAGKNLFVLPGNVNSDASRGCNLLLKEVQAALFLDYREVLLSMGINPEESQKQAMDCTLTPSERQIVRVLSGADRHIDDICQRLEFDTASAAALLSVLEIKGVVKKLPANKYGLTAQYMSG